jgi:hypothetical protein
MFVREVSRHWFGALAVVTFVVDPLETFSQPFFK